MNEQFTKYYLQVARSRKTKIKKLSFEALNFNFVFLDFRL